MAIPLCRSTWAAKKLKQEKPFLTFLRQNWSGNSIRFGVHRSLFSTKVIGQNGSLSINPIDQEAIQVPKAKLSDAWREIHGQNDWVGMLDPIDPLLQSELLRYGDMAQSCYDAYDFDPYSKFCGSSKVNPNMFFQNLGWKNCNYEVTSYLYSTYNVKFPNFFAKSVQPDGWSHSANWIGYLAVSSDEYSKHLGRRDITIAWRGTVTNSEKLADLMDFQNATSYHTIPSRDPTIKVEAGFLEIYTSKRGSCKFCKHSAREQVLAEVKRLTELYQDEELSITITGHSLGSALATLNAYDIAEIGLDVMEDGRTIPVSVFSFAGPRVGNSRFRERLEGLGVKVLRVLNVHDAVPKVPGMFFNECKHPFLQYVGKLTPWCYFHVGQELPLDHHSSPFLKQVRNPAYAHDLELLLHLLDGYYGKGRRFWLRSGRELALVNKATDFLKEHLLVPPNWWKTNKKVLIESPLGQWMMPQEQNLEVQEPPQDIENHLSMLRLSTENCNPPIANLLQSAPEAREEGQTNRAQIPCPNLTGEETEVVETELQPDESDEHREEEEDRRSCAN